MEIMLSVKMEKEDLDLFKKNCGTTKPYQIMIREMITAFNENRLRIIPTKDQNNLLNIYKRKEN